MVLKPPTGSMGLPAAVLCLEEKAFGAFTVLSVLRCRQWIVTEAMLAFSGVFSQTEEKGRWKENEYAVLAG